MKRDEKFVYFSGREYYSENFKKKVVREVESGELTKEAARIKYQIKGNSAVLNWCRQYGKNKYSLPTHKVMQMATNQVLKERIKELERELSKAKMGEIYYRSVVNQLNKIGIDAEKKYAEQALKNAEEHGKKKSADSQ